jgi:hypothetical protein
MLRSALLCIALAAPIAAHAGTAWRCELTPDLTRLACRAEPAQNVAADDPAPTTTAVVNGTRFPLDAAQPWFVEMWSPASDMEWVALLARSTICYRSPGCTVQVAPPRASLTAAR